MALGATVAQGVNAVVLPVILLTTAGLFVGVAVSQGATRLLRSLLWGVMPGDALTTLAVCGMMLTFSIAASVIPGLRVAAIDPAVSLRDE